MPGLQALYQKTDTAKVAFVLISLDANPDKARALLKRKGYTLPVFFPPRRCPRRLIRPPFRPPSSSRPPASSPTATSAWPTTTRPNFGRRWKSWPTEPAWAGREG
ncbi:MAG: hypothetical protein WKG07_01420 [Hymenobacter sp.]